MPTASHCQECGRRLTDVLFCPRCGEWFCCTACLAEDKARHLRSRANTNKSLAYRPVRIARTPAVKYSCLD